MKKIIIEPMGPLFFRKDRDFSNVGANILTSYDFPTRKSLAVVVAKYITKQLKDRENSAHHNMDIKGPFLGLKDTPSGHWEPYVHIAMNGVVCENNILNIYHKASIDYISDQDMLGLNKTVPWDMTKTMDGLFKLRDVLKNQFIAHPRPYADMFVRAGKIGIGLQDQKSDTRKKQVEEKKLYQIEPIYLKDCVYIFYTNDMKNDVKKDIDGEYYVPLGGEQFLVKMTISDAGEEAKIFDGMCSFEEATQNNDHGVFYHITDMVIPGRIKSQSTQGKEEYEKEPNHYATLSKYATPLNQLLKSKYRYVGEENRERAYLHAGATYSRLILRDNYIIPRDYNTSLNVQGVPRLITIGSNKYGCGLLLELFLSYKLEPETHQATIMEQSSEIDVTNNNKNVSK